MGRQGVGAPGGNSGGRYGGDGENQRMYPPANSASERRKVIFLVFFLVDVFSSGVLPRHLSVCVFW